MSNSHKLSPLACDVLVVGSGAGGLSVAVAAAHLGLDVLVVEKQMRFGGTTAWSGGWLWIPRNPLARAAGIEEPIDTPLAYLRHELGSGFDEPRLRAYLEHGPRMVEFFRARTALQFIDGNLIPDFHGRTPDAGTGGRSVCAAPFDGRLLGEDLDRLEPPLRETTLWGMGIAAGAELRHFINARWSSAALSYVLRRLLRHGWDLLVHQRGTRLVNGNALAGALLRSALDVGVRLLEGAAVARLRMDAGRITGAVLDTPYGEREVQARRAVVLACGGFPHDPVRRKQLLPHAPTGAEHWSAASPGNTGDGLRLGESAGARVSTDLAQAAALAPVSQVDRGDGTTANFPHLIERAKPGLLAVTAQGRRFANEADSYHDFVQQLLQAVPQRPEAWLVCDHRFIRRYGLGAAKPAPMRLGSWLRSGYLRRGRTLAALAQACGIDAAALAQTVERYNGMARAGVDEDFGKGQTPYNRIQGDAAWAQRQGLTNPCMAPLERGPFYAVRIVPGSLGTFAGLQVNADAQALDAQGQPIEGLYAAGNDMSSVMAGHYPAGGITLGPAMTFGLLAAEHIAGRRLTAEIAPS